MEASIFDWHNGIGSSSAEFVFTKRDSPDVGAQAMKAANTY